jgi:hypothetical protein
MVISFDIIYSTLEQECEKLIMFAVRRLLLLGITAKTKQTLYIRQKKR